jgi:hypothetical protein
MRTFVFIGNPGAEDSRSGVRAFGVYFPANVPVEVENEAAARKLAGNSHFREVIGGVVDEEQGGEEAPERGEPQPAEAKGRRGRKQEQ